MTYFCWYWRQEQFNFGILSAKGAENPKIVFASNFCLGCKTQAQVIRISSAGLRLTLLILEFIG